jgi:hypothetical protein
MSDMKNRKGKKGTHTILLLLILSFFLPALSSIEKPGSDLGEGYHLIVFMEAFLEVMSGKLIQEMKRR